MKIITWNMNYCWGARKNPKLHVAGLEYLRTLDVDIALLQEVRFEKTEIRFEHYNPFHERQNEWGSAILLKEHLTVHKKYPFAGTYEGSSTLMCYDITLPNKKEVLTVINAYGANASNQFNKTKFCSTTMHHILSDITPMVYPKYRHTPFILLAGDFNVTTQWDEHNHDPSHKLVFDRIEDIGLIHCTKKWYKKEHIQTHIHRNSNIPWQDDYIFVTEPLYYRMTDCKVHDKATKTPSGLKLEELSDHLPVEIEIEL